MKHCTQCVTSVPILVLFGTLVSLGLPRFTRVSTKNCQMRKTMMTTLRKKAMNYLSRREHSCLELKNKLLSKIIDHKKKREHERPRSMNGTVSSK